MISDTRFNCSCFAANRKPDFWVEQLSSQDGSQEEAH